jgi:penicillin-binding protein 2
VIREGLYEATHSPLGTSSTVFGHFPIGIAGKTGTAEKIVDGHLTNTSWWCGFGPFDPSTSTKSLVVCAVIENGGYGGAAAAPSALQVFESYFGTKASAFSQANTD